MTVTTANRRREVGFASARSLLLTVLGEFVHPRARPVWTSTLLEAMAALGVEEKSARQALARTASEGVLTSNRDGRRVHWSLTAHGETLLREGTERIYSFLRSSHPWDGRWLVLTVSLPETQRALRHQLRTRLTWLGLGSPSPGLWVTPEAAHLEEVRRVVADLDLAGRSFAWVGAACRQIDSTAGVPPMVSAQKRSGVAYIAGLESLGLPESFYPVHPFR